jgi:biopolymer transport protein ExbB
MAVSIWIRLRAAPGLLRGACILCAVSASGALAQAPATAELPRDLTPWGMFVSADPLVKAVLIGLVFASVVTWTVWLAKTLELVVARRHVKADLATLGSTQRLTDGVERLAATRGPAQAFLDAALARSSCRRTAPSGKASRSASPRGWNGSKPPADGGSCAAPACSPPSGRPPRSWACSARSGAS